MLYSAHTSKLAGNACNNSYHMYGILNSHLPFCLIEGHLLILGEELLQTGKIRHNIGLA